MVYKYLISHISNSHTALIAHSHIPVLSCHFPLLLLRLEWASDVVHSKLYLIEKVGGKLRGPAGRASDRKDMAYMMGNSILLFPWYGTGMEFREGGRQKGEIPF